MSQHLRVLVALLRPRFNSQHTRQLTTNSSRSDSLTNTHADKILRYRKQNHLWTFYPKQIKHPTPPFWRYSLCSPGWPEIHYAVQAGLNRRDLLSFKDMYHWLELILILWSKQSSVRGRLSVLCTIGHLTAYQHLVDYSGPHGGIQATPT